MLHIKQTRRGDHDIVCIALGRQRLKVSSLLILEDKFFICLPTCNISLVKFSVFLSQFSVGISQDTNIIPDCCRSS